MLSVAGNDAYGFFGEQGGVIGPCRIYWDTEPISNASGTIQVSGNTVTGTGTTFQTLFNFDEGDIYLKANTTPNPTILRVKQVSSNTSMTVLDPKTLQDSNVTIASGTTFSLFRTIDLGRTTEEGVTLKIEEKKAGVKSAQDGDVDINHFSTGTEISIEFSLIETSLEKLFYLSKGSMKVSHDANGLITGAAIGSRLGRNFKKNSKRMTLILYKDGDISTDPKDRIDIFHVHPNFTIEKKMDINSIHSVKLSFVAYKSDTYTINGKGYYPAINPNSITWD